MNVLVFIKQVADTEARIIIAGDGKALEIENKYVINFFDEFAVEEAIRLKEKNGETQVTVCTYGPARAIEALRTAVAMGADRAFLLDGTDYEYDDSLVVARVLAAFAEKEGFDLILCGRQAIDDENANIGAMVAELLGIPHVSSVTRLDLLDGGRIEVESEMEGGRKRSEIVLPALLTTQKGLNEPRVPMITGVMKAMKTQIPTIDVTTMGLAKETLERGASKVVTVSYEVPAQRPAVRIIEGVSSEEKVRNLVEALKTDAKVM